MPRHPRLFIPGATYHVYCRVARGEFVFNDDYEAIEFIETLCEVRDLDGWTIFAWCLMGNHYHLVLKTQTIDLWRSMARLQGRVSRAHNRRHRYLGRLWQSRYRARVIGSNEYFQQVVAYVHLNPVSAGIVDDPGDFVFSGHREIIGLCRPRIIHLPSVIRGFGGGEPREAVNDYLRCIRSVAETRWAAADVSDLPWWAEARHVDEIADPNRHSKATTFDRQRLAEDRAELGLPDFVVRFESASGYRLDDLASRFRNEQYIRGRIEFSLVAVSRYGFRACDIAARLCKGRNSVTRWLNRGLCDERDDPEFSERINRLDAEISRK
jgi:REP element-mobilizing transposase RayT